MTTLRSILCTLFMLGFAIALGYSRDATPAQSASTAVPSSAPTAAVIAAKPDPDLEGKFEERTAKIMGVLKLSDSAGAQRIHDAIIAHYEGINAWHAANDKEIAALKKPAPGATKPSDDAKAEIARRNASLAEIHARFITALSKDLDAAQIDQVKDDLTYGKVKFTYDGYLRVYPTLTDADKAVVLSYLKQAREDGIDGSNVAQKNAIFGVYKGRIQNYLSRHGYSSKPGAKAGALKAPSTVPAPQPAANPS